MSPDMAIISGCGPITLSVWSSDPDDDSLSYSWSALPDVGSFADESEGSTVWWAPDPGESSMEVVLTLTVSDGHGGTATDYVVVTIRGGVAEAEVGG